MPCLPSTCLLSSSLPFRPPYSLPFYPQGEGGEAAAEEEAAAVTAVNMRARRMHCPRATALIPLPNTHTHTHTHIQTHTNTHTHTHTHTHTGGDVGDVKTLTARRRAPKLQHRRVCVPHVRRRMLRGHFSLQPFRLHLFGPRVCVCVCVCVCV